MPDTTSIPGAEGGNTNSGGPNWVLIGGVAVGLLVLLYFISKAGGSKTQTTAAGTSINAALGSVQEENLNLMGQLGQTRADILAGQAGIGGQVTQSESDLMAELNQVNGNVIVGNQSNATGIANLGAGLSQGLDYYSKQNQALTAAQSDYLGQMEKQLLADLQGVPYEQVVPFSQTGHLHPIATG